jgi:hypothetical protein
VNKSSVGDRRLKLRAFCDDDDGSISVDSLLARGRRENLLADIRSPDTFVTRRESEGRLARAVNGMPRSVGSSNNNRTTLEALQRIVRARQPLLLVSDGRWVEEISNFEGHILHLAGLRSTRKVRRWLRDLTSIVNGTYILVTPSDAGRWAAYRLSAALSCNDCFITYWPKTTSEGPSSLRAALNRAVGVDCCGGVEGVDDAGALLLLFLDRFGVELKQDHGFIRRVASLAASRSHEFQQLLFSKCLEQHGISSESFAMALREAEQRIARRKFNKVVQRALSV